MNTATHETASRNSGQLVGQPENVIPMPKPPRCKPRILVDGHFVVKEFENASGSKSFRVDGYKRDQTRVRENYAEELRARARQIELETEWLQGEARTEIKATKLTDEQLSLAEAAFIRLGPGAERELPLAIENWIAQRLKKPPAESPRLDDAFTEFSTWLEKCELRELSRKNLQRRVKVFVNSVPNQHVADVTPETIDAYLAKRAVSTKSKDNDRRAVSRFFSWCMGYQDGERVNRRWTTANPCRREKQRGRKDGTQPAILTLEQCKKLLGAAEKHKRGVLAPYVAVCLFAGLRPFEAKRLTWQAVNLTDREIRLEPEQTKTGASRVVTICDALLAWLNAYKGKPFCPKNWRRDLDAIKAAAGLVQRATAKSKGTVKKRKKGKLVNARHYWKRIVPIAWAPDILRHTAASHYFRNCGSYGQTAEQFGNSEAIIKRHYQGRVSSEDTAKFYAILPKKGGRK